MADPTDIADLARRYLDLWREQARLVGDDPLFVGLLESLNRAAKQAADATAKANGGKAARTAGTAAAGRPAGDGESGGADLARRLAACEKRIARLERELAKLGRSTGAPARRRRPGKAD